MNEAAVGAVEGAAGAGAGGGHHRTQVQEAAQLGRCGFGQGADDQADVEDPPADETGSLDEGEVAAGRRAAHGQALAPDAERLAERGHMVGVLVLERQPGRDEHRIAGHAGRGGGALGAVEVAPRDDHADPPGSVVGSAARDGGGRGGDGLPQDAVDVVRVRHAGEVTGVGQFLVARAGDGLGQPTGGLQRYDGVQATLDHRSRQVQFRQPAQQVRFAGEQVQVGQTDIGIHALAAQQSRREAGQPGVVPRGGGHGGHVLRHDDLEPVDLADAVGVPVGAADGGQ
ncbi:hypothetical protein SHIRM173S_07540 [Streptomyces hirsutus]